MISLFSSVQIPEIMHTDRLGKVGKYVLFLKYIVVINITKHIIIRSMSYIQ